MPKPSKKLTVHDHTGKPEMTTRIRAPQCRLSRYDRPDQSAAQPIMLTVSSTPLSGWQAVPRIAIAQQTCAQRTCDPSLTCAPLAR